MRVKWVIIIFIAVSLMLSACSSPPSTNPFPTSPNSQQTHQTLIPETIPPLRPSLPVQTAINLPLRIISLTSPINPGLPATLIVETLPEAECSAIIDYGPSGNSILPSRIADGSGRVSWNWLVGKFSGTWQITIKASYGGKTASMITLFTVR